MSIRNALPGALRFACALAATCLLAAPSHADEHGAVYVLTNQASGNSVLVYDRAADGTLTYAASYATGGTGAGSGGDPLGSQGSLVHREGYVFAVNAGSNDVTVFRAWGAELQLVTRVASGGQMPVSLDVKGCLVYVLNAGGTPNVSGFRFDPYDGRLTPLPGSQRPLAGGSAAAPAEIHFSADGEVLVVTEKGTQSIDTYRVDGAGYASAPQSYASSGATPFGFAVTRRGFVVVSEAVGSVSTYDLYDSGKLQLVTGSVLLGQSADCWLLTSEDGRFAFSANAGSNTISSLAVAADGKLALVNAAAATPAAPLDMALTHGGRFLYVRDGTGNLTGYAVASDGSLTYVASASGVPAGSQGIAAR